MSLQINIILPDDNVSRNSLDMHMDALGFARGSVAAPTGINTSGLSAVNANIGTAEAPIITNTPRAGESEAQTTARRTRKAKDEPKTEPAQNISSGEERVDPADDEATQQQDAADEAAEKGDAPALTADDIRKEIGNYAKAHGVDKAQARGYPIFVSVLGEHSTGSWKVTDIPADKIGAVVDAWKLATIND